MISASIALIKMVAAHLLGDFICQNDKMCHNKYATNHRQKFSALTIHALIQAGLTYLFLAQWQDWIVAALIGVSHFCIDWIKSSFKDKGLKTFIVDQCVHFLTIALLWWIYFVKLNHVIGISSYFLSLKAWIFFTALIAVLSPTSILIKKFLEYEKWAPDSHDYKGLPNAGKWIGYLERILILIFIFTDNIEGVGFLLAAKSIFRFGELNKAKELKITEYVLIGTLSSFTIAILIAYSALFVVNLMYE